MFTFRKCILPKAPKVPTVGFTNLKIPKDELGARTVGFPTDYVPAHQKFWKNDVQARDLDIWKMKNHRFQLGVPARPRYCSLWGSGLRGKIGSREPKPICGCGLRTSCFKIELDMTLYYLFPPRWSQGLKIFQSESCPKSKFFLSILASAQILMKKISIFSENSMLFSRNVVRIHTILAIFRKKIIFFLPWRLLSEFIFFDFFPFLNQKYFFFFVWTCLKYIFLCVNICSIMWYVDGLEVKIFIGK